MSFLWQTGVTCLVWVADVVFPTLGVSHQWWFVSTYILAQSRADGRYSGSKSAFEWSSWSLVAEFRVPSYEHTMPSGLKNLFAQSLPTRDVLECSEDSPLLVCLEFPSEGNQNSCGKGADSDCFCIDSGRHPKSGRWGSSKYLGLRRTFWLSKPGKKDDCLAQRQNPGCRHLSIVSKRFSTSVLLFKGTNCILSI